MAIDYAASRRLRKLRPEVAWETIEDLAQYEEEGWNDPVVPEGESINYENPDLEQLLGVMECKVEPSRQQAFKDLVMNFIPDQEERVKQLEEYMGVVRSDFIQLSLKFPILRSGSRKRKNPEPPIKPPSMDSDRIKEVDHLTIHTPPSPHMASFHPKDVYCYYRPCIDDPKKHYGFKPCLLGHNRSLGVDFSNMEMIENECELESKEVCFLGRGLNSPVRPKEVEKVRIEETHHLEHIIQQPIFQHVAPSYNNGRKAHLLEDKQIPSVGVFDEVFSTWMSFGGNTCDLGSFGEETDKITDLHKSLKESCSQSVETASQA
ncbi:hypothetical protein Tco_1304519 [Tanacetum coccineum]